jgi:hypothetical protein
MTNADRRPRNQFTTTQFGMVQTDKHPPSITLEERQYKCLISISTASGYIISPRARSFHLFTYIKYYQEPSAIGAALTKQP